MYVEPRAAEEVTQAEKDELVARVAAAVDAHTDEKLLQLIAYLRNTGVKCAQSSTLPGESATADLR